MKVIIVGGGKTGEKLAQILSKEKNDVVVIEKDEKRAEELAEKLDVLVLCGDGCDINILKDAGVEYSDSVLVLTGDDDVNISICKLVKEMKIHNIVAKLNLSQNEKKFEKTDIKYIDSNLISALAFKRCIEKQGKHLITFVAGGKAEIFEILVNKNSKLNGRLVNEIAKNFSVVCIYRDDKVLIPKSDMKIKEGDILAICAPLEEVKKIEEIL
ncbi:MAG: NAD-binding protein [Candidatus Aenigmatarchaeota archaeon]